MARYPFFILDVYEPQCNPARGWKAAVHELSVELGDKAAFRMMNGTNNPLIEERYNVTGYPTLLVFVNGSLVDRSEGFASRRYIVGGLSMVKTDLDTSQVTYDG